MNLAPVLAAEIPWFFRTIFPWAFVYVGCHITAQGVKAVFIALASKRWPSVTGRVVRTRVESEDIGEDSTNIVYLPVIEFEYAVAGTAHTSDKVGLAAYNPGSEKRAKELVKRYKVGRSVRVFHSPRDPAVAILEPGVRWPMFGALAFGLFVLASGLTMLVFFNGAGKGHP